PGASVSTSANASPAKMTQMMVPACHNVSSGLGDSEVRCGLPNGVMRRRSSLGVQMLRLHGVKGILDLLAAARTPDCAARTGSAGRRNAVGLGYGVHTGSGMPIFRQPVVLRPSRGALRPGAGFSLIELMVVVAIVAI